MKYLCLVYHDEDEWADLPRRERDTLGAQILAHREELRQSGRLIAADALQPAHSVTTLQVRNGALSLTDGPLLEGEVQLDSFYLIDAGDLNEAIRIAAQTPFAAFATIEVRPIKELAGS